MEPGGDTSVHVGMRAARKQAQAGRWDTYPWLSRWVSAPHAHLQIAALAFVLSLPAIVLLASPIYRALSLPSPAGGLATFFFAMHAGQSMTTGWIAGRSTLLAVLFGFASLRLYLAARRSRGVLIHAAAVTAS